MLAGEKCSSVNGNYILEAIYGAIEWFGFKTTLIDLEHEEENDENMPHIPFCYQKLIESMDDPNMLGIVIRSGSSDSNEGHYWCILKSSADSFKIIDSMNDEIKELDKEWTLDFIQSYHEEYDSYNQIKQFICVIMTESSYNCKVALLGNKISYGYTYQDRLNIFLNEKKKAQETFKECAANGCDFNISKNIVHDTFKKKP